MSRRGLVERMKSWFSALGRERHHPTGLPVGPWSARAVRPATGVLLAGVGGSGAAPGPSVACAFDGSASATPSSAATAVATAPDDLPTDPEHEARTAEWMHLLDTLPERIAESLAASTAGATALEKIGNELDGHRAATRSLAQSIGRMPELASDQIDLLKRMNEVLVQQTQLAEASVDGLVAMRGPLKSVEESAQRHLTCIANLESSHRQVLEIYQGIVLKTHRRLGRLAIFAILLATAAIGSVAYLLYFRLG